MKYAMRVIAKPDCRKEEHISAMARMAEASFRRKLIEDNITISGDLFVDIIISDKEEEDNAL